MAPSKRSSSPRTRATATLEPRTAHVPTSTILKKWKPLQPSSQEQVRRILTSLKARHGASSRIVPPRSRRGAAASSNVPTAAYERVVEEVADRLTGKLPRMPFPPAGTAAEDFDFAATLRRVEALSAQLGANQTAARLLRTQVACEKAQLRRDRAELQALQGGLAGAQAQRRRQARSLHRAARMLDQGADEDTTTAAAAAGTADEGARGGADATVVLDDPALQPLLAQLRSHLGSMQGNIAGVAGVLEGVEDARVALDLFALKRLGGGGLGAVQ